jgi:hypothetical protein
MATGNLENSNTLGSNLSDYFNYIRKQPEYSKQYGTDLDFIIVDKFYYKNEAYDSVYAILDYKRSGDKPDDLTYSEVVTYNREIWTPANMVTQFISVEVFILKVVLLLNGYSRQEFRNWEINRIDVFKYLGGNPRPQLSGIRPSVVLDGKEIRDTTTGVRINLKSIVNKLSVSQYMAWELQYRERKRKEICKILKHRNYLLGKK